MAGRIGMDGRQQPGGAVGLPVPLPATAGAATATTEVAEEPVRIFQLCIPGAGTNLSDTGPANKKSTSPGGSGQGAGGAGASPIVSPILVDGHVDGHPAITSLNKAGRSQVAAVPAEAKARGPEINDRPAMVIRAGSRSVPAGSKASDDRYDYRGGTGPTFRETTRPVAALLAGRPGRPRPEPPAG